MSMSMSMSTMNAQDTHATATQTGYYVPVMPTEESQDDTAMSHPIVSCWECDTEWRSYELSRCPGCARHIGAERVLSEEETRDLMEAISHLKEETFDADTEYETWEFHSLLEKHVSWYDMGSRVLIQACYFALLKQAPHPKVVFAIDFLHMEYAEAPDSEMMYDPNRTEVPAHVVAWGEYLDRQKQRDRMTPSW